LSKGYVYKGENQWDDMYKHSSVVVVGVAAWKFLTSRFIIIYYL
jgi:hypothetical protein